MLSLRVSKWGDFRAGSRGRSSGESDAPPAWVEPAERTAGKGVAVGAINITEGGGLVIRESVPEPSEWK